MIYSGADIKEALPQFSPHTSVLKLLLEALKRNGDKVYQIDGRTGDTETFATLLQNSCSISTNLRLRGVTEGDLVVMCCDKSPAAFSVLFGTWFTGATAVLIPPPILENDIHKLTNDHPVKIVFCDALYQDSVVKYVKHMSVQPDTITKEEVTTTLMIPSEKFNLFEVKDVKKHIPLIIFTSGTTGDAKGVMISDLALQRYGYSCECGFTDIFLMTSAFTWISCTARFIAIILNGCTLILSNSTDPTEHLNLIQKYRVTIWFFNLARINHYVKECSLLKPDLSSLTDIRIAGEVIMPKLTEEFIMNGLQGRLGVVKNAYAMTETGVLTTWKGTDHLDMSKTISCGYPAPGVQFKVKDEEGNEVRTGDPGILWVKSLSLCNQYWNRPDLNSERFEKDGFFLTGDIGYFDKEGFLFVKGRVSDLNSFGQYQALILNIEDILRSHSDISDAAIVVKPGSCELITFVVKSPDSNITEDDIINIIKEQVEEKSLTGGVRFIDKLPKTASQKILRRELLNMLL